MFCRPLVQVVDISERSIPCFPNISVMGLASLHDESRSTKDSPDLAWGLCFQLVILWSRPLIVNIVLQVPMVDKVLYLVLQCDTLLSVMADDSVKLTELVLVLFRVIST